MKTIVFQLFSLILISECFCVDPTNYEYYTNGGIKTGLTADSEHFHLNGKQIQLLSGSMHYFRIPHQYWKDRLLKMRAAGLNTVQTYTPWNLHELIPGQFDFETGFLNLAGFLKAAKEADLFVFFRIGPYMCAEWDLGGYPSWLLKDPNMKLRTNYKPHMNAVEIFFKKTLAIINEYQFTKGGPIIAMQFENEFSGIQNSNDHEYFQFMKDTIVKSGFKELLSNCYNHIVKSSQRIGEGVLDTINFNSHSLDMLKKFREVQPNKPQYVSEFWPGHASEWGMMVKGLSDETFEKEVTDVVITANASINFFMFVNGNNFGFMAGGYGGSTHTPNYRTAAPLTESGNYTKKYWIVKQIMEKLVKERHLPKTHIPEPPKIEPAHSYGIVNIKDYLSFEDLLTQIKPIESNEPKYMEFLSIGPNYGQNFGFILYRIITNKFSKLKLNGVVHDNATVLIDDKEVAIINKHNNHDFKLNVTSSHFANKTQNILDIFVENEGRAKIGNKEMDSARKGLNGSVEIDDKKVSKYDIFPMEFKQKFVESLKQLKGRPLAKVSSPSLFRTELHIKDQPKDTYLRLDNWKKGSVFVNGFNIGHYWDIGPQKTLYIPAPFLKTGVNDIFVFELHSAHDKINFVDKPEGTFS